MFYVYIIRSDRTRGYYIGHTKNLKLRLEQHNSNRNRSTKNKGPWKIIYSEGLNTKKEAYRREFEIKSYKSGEAFKKLINK